MQAPLALDRLLRPRSVVIVGASDKPGSLGASVLANLERQGFAGPIHLVNPKRSEIGGRPCVASVDDLPSGIDAAVLAIPRAGVLDVIRGLAARSVGAAVVFSAGFAEDGPQGLADQEEIGRIARDAGMVVEGPNCLGLVNFVDRVSLTFITMPEARAVGPRRVGIVSQSGAMAAVLATTFIARDVPLSAYISTGNEAASGVEDYLAHLVASPETAVIAMVVEHFRRPAAFLAAARAARAAGKTIVLLHPGSSDAGAASAATHTGAMAGSYAVMKVHAEAAGVIVVASLEELGDVTEIAVRFANLPRGGVGIVAESGALKAMLLDLSEAVALDLPPLGDADSPALRAALPAFVPVSNPTDITAQGLIDPGLYGRTIAALLGDDRIDTVLVTLIQTEPGTSGIKFAAVAEALDAGGMTKPVIVAGVDEGGEVAPSDIARLRGLGVVYLPTPERAVRALARIDGCAATVVHALGGGEGLAGLPPAGSIVPEYRAKELLRPYGIDVPGFELTQTVAAAVAAADRLGYPVVLKAQAAALPHKSDAGGVIIGLADAAAVAAGWERLHANLAASRPELDLDGVLVEAMAAKGVELIVGARRDPAWGPTLLVGFGGVAAELLHDVVLLPPGLSRAEIVAAIRTLRLAPLLDGFRGAPVCDIDAVAAIVEALGRVVGATPGITEVDLNPVVAYPNGALVLDALIST
ncbi:acetate--CoA ligase family protein [Polymorphobacter sp. PAMC 29334]|uniref:acetate--CoA ligase family protein n=1 Tax=Polymorphobacter sp. PAMC 29334 TaxID=2862331 RepID=UPI001C778E28|nr:acetate--CoA ligase family protein [Polymorphobacter sp. PAMC 29334]QYE36724.1 acetate--CoA ligase family protein [Polymorphobacter sp. PAMC 29334]